MTGATTGLEESVAGKALDLIFHMQAFFHNWASFILFIISGKLYYSLVRYPMYCNSLIQAIYCVFVVSYLSCNYFL